MELESIKKNVRKKVTEFFKGRYGIDDLTNFMIVCAIILLILNPISRFYLLSMLFLMLAVGVLFAAAVRVVSKDIKQRKEENRGYLSKKQAVKMWFVVQYRRIRDIKTHRYIKCEHCGKTLRVKKILGKRKIKCPLCSERFEINIRF